MHGEVREIDGAAFRDLDGFAAEFSSKVLLGAHRWLGNLDAFNDILRGGFGTPEGGFTLRIVNAAAARRALGYDATIEWLEERVRNCHPTNVPDMKARLESARRSEGETLFDMIVAIIRDHGPGGGESEDGVFLELA